MSIRYWALLRAKWRNVKGLQILNSVMDLYHPAEHLSRGEIRSTNEGI